MKIISIILASIAGIAVISEIGLRTIAGLGTPPLYIADPDIGYLLAPNQKLRRQGSRYETNQYSMRSQPLQDRAEDRILLLGDSVVNGSWWTDRDQTLSSLLADKLQDDSIEATEVLNISANSWGPRNELAYLQRFGLFDASTLILVINTDDLLATEPTSLVVGKSPSYPSKKPSLALIEYYQLFIAPPQSIPKLEQLKTTPESDRLEQNLAAIEEIEAIADASGIEFILVLTPLLKEFQSGPSESELESRNRLQKLVADKQIDYIDILAEWADFPQPEFLYRDRIHPTPQGNAKIIEAIAEQLTS